MPSSLAFDERYYLTQYPDVLAGIASGTYSSAAQHYEQIGAREFRNPNAVFNAREYAINNPDVLAAVSSGTYSSAWQHYQTQGVTENRAPSSAYEGFNAEAYLAANPDIAAAVQAGTVPSALEHYLEFGAAEGRSANLPGQTQFLTVGKDAFTGTAGDDVFTAEAYNAATSEAATTLNAIDSIDGGGGQDTLNIRVVGTQNATLGGTVKNVEIINIDNTTADGAAAHGGSGVDASKFGGATQVWQIGKEADLVNLAAGTTAGFRNTTGDLVVKAAEGATSASIALDGAAAKDSGNILGLTVSGPALSGVSLSGTLAQNDKTGDPASVALGFTAGTDVETVTLNSAFATALTLTQAGGSTKNVTTLDASASTGAITYGGSTKVQTTKTGAGNDDVTLTTATTNTAGALADTGAGADKVTVSTTGTGTTTVNTGDGNDSVTVTGAGSGVFSINLGGGDDVLNMGTRALTATDSVNGGDGMSDILLLAGKSMNKADYDLVGSQVSDVEVLGFTGTTAAVVDASKLSQFGTLGFTGNAGDTVTNTVSGQTILTGGDLKASAQDYETGKANGVALNIGAGGTGTIDANGSTVNLTVAPADDASGGGITSTLTGDFTAANVTLTPSQDFTGGKASGDNTASVVFVAADAAAATTLTITGSGIATVTGGEKLATIDASGLGGAYTVDAGANKAGDIYGGLTFTGDAAVKETVTLGAGQDTIVLGSTVGDLDTVIAFDSTKEGAGANAVTDVLEFGGVTLNGGSAGQATKVTLTSGATTLEAAFTEAAVVSAATGSDDGKVVVFQFQGDTYLYQDLTGTAGTVDNTDLAVQVVGVHAFETAFGAAPIS